MAYTLQLGSNGIDVKKMQYYINQILAAPNLTPMEEDGIYGQKTEFAVAVFQYVYHLNVDGIIGQATWDKIIQEFKNLPSPAMERNKSTRTLRVGNIGLGVQKFQQYLNELIAPNPRLVVDGNFGQNTKRAVETFQALNGLNVDGIIGNNTWDRIINRLQETVSDISRKGLNFRPFHYDFRLDVQLGMDYHNNSSI